MPTFAYRILPPRADFVATITPEEAAIMGAHFEYLSKLFDQGKIVFVGRTENGDYGLGIFDLPDEATFDAVVAGDPAVAAGLVRAEKHAFKVVFNRSN